MPLLEILNPMLYFFFNLRFDLKFPKIGVVGFQIWFYILQHQTNRYRHQYNKFVLVSVKKNGLTLPWYQTSLMIYDCQNQSFHMSEFLVNLICIIKHIWRLMNGIVSLLYQQILRSAKPAAVPSWECAKLQCLPIHF